ncbi:MAG: hypothetical protein QXO70_02975, partial [Candidatus Pacearchaeota archaeon]
MTNGKRIVVSGPEDLEYKDVLAYTKIPEILNVGEESRIKIFWKEESSFVNFNARDTDNNGKLDYIEWIVPHSSNQTFEIIIITKAEHLDENRNFIEEVYEKVKTRDNNYTEIPANHYLRVTFQQNLTKEKDITIYAKSQNNAKIEVYEKDSDELIADFGIINEDKEYKVYLTNLQGSQDTFDLKVIGGNVEFDYVVDPSVLVLGNAARDISLTPINATSFIIAWVDAIQNKISFRIYDTLGNILVNTIDVDTNTLPNDSRVDIAMINSSAFVVGWIDGGEDDITFAI